MSENAPLIVSISGIRGIAGQSLTDQVIAQFASAFACFLPERAAVVLARDTRPSGKEFASVAARALSQAGCTYTTLEHAQRRRLNSWSVSLVRRARSS